MHSRLLCWAAAVSTLWVGLAATPSWAEKPAKRRVVALDTGTANWLKRQSPKMTIDVLINDEEDAAFRIDRRAWSICLSNCTVFHREQMSPLAGIYLQRLKSHGVPVVNISDRIRKERDRLEIPVKRLKIVEASDLAPQKVVRPPHERLAMAEPSNASPASRLHSSR